MCQIISLSRQSYSWYVYSPYLLILASNIVNRLYEHVRDKDAQVAASAIHALEEILRTEGGIAVNKAMVRVG